MAADAKNPARKARKTRNSGPEHAIGPRRTLGESRPSHSSKDRLSARGTGRVRRRKTTQTPGRSPQLPPPLPKDIALLHGPTEDGEGARVLRFKEGALYAGEVRPVREGQNVAQHELVRLKPLAGNRALCEVETVHASPEVGQPSQQRAPERSHGGPARVSNGNYRKNWSLVFGSAKKAGPQSSLN